MVFHRYRLARPARSRSKLLSRNVAAIERPKIAAQKLISGDGRLPIISDNLSFQFLPKILLPPMAITVRKHVLLPSDSRRCGQDRPSREKAADLTLLPPEPGCSHLYTTCPILTSPGTVRPSARPARIFLPFGVKSISCHRRPASLLRVIACIETPEAIKRILLHLATRHGGGINAPPRTAARCVRRTAPPITDPLVSAPTSAPRHAAPHLLHPAPACLTSSLPAPPNHLDRETHALAPTTSLTTTTTPRPRRYSPNTASPAPRVHTPRAEQPFGQHAPATVSDGRWNWSVAAEVELSCRSTAAIPTGSAGISEMAPIGRRRGWNGAEVAPWNGLSGR